jgi:hypothetical protein
MLFPDSYIYQTVSALAEYRGQTNGLSTFKKNLDFLEGIIVKNGLVELFKEIASFWGDSYSWERVLKSLLFIRQIAENRELVTPLEVTFLTSPQYLAAVDSIKALRIKRRSWFEYELPKIGAITDLVKFSVVSQPLWHKIHFENWPKYIKVSIKRFIEIRGKFFEKISSPKYTEKVNNFLTRRFKQYEELRYSIDPVVRLDVQRAIAYAGELSTDIIEDVEKLTKWAEEACHSMMIGSLLSEVATEIYSILYEDPETRRKYDGRYERLPGNNFRSEYA